MGGSQRRVGGDVDEALADLVSHHSVLAAAVGRIGRQSSLSPPRLVDVHIQGHAGLTVALHRLDGARLVDVVRTPLPWPLNRAMALPVHHWPVASSTSAAGRLGAAASATMVTAYRGLYSAWVCWFTHDLTSCTSDSIIASAQQLQQAIARTSVLCPVGEPVTLPVSGRKPVAVCDAGRRWLARPGTSRAIMRAVHAAPAPSWFAGARITFEGQRPSLIATLTPFRPADVLSVAQLTDVERAIFSAAAHDHSAREIAEHHHVSLDTVHRTLRASGNDKRGLDTMLRDAWRDGS